MIWDSFMLHDELDFLECRLVELEDIPNLKHVVIEADVTHQDDPKPSYLSDHWSRFERWHDRIIRVWATNLPTKKDQPDPWAREHAQREWAVAGLCDAERDDVVLHGDLDEFPTAVAVRNVKPPGFVAFDMAFHPFAVDWIHPARWNGTVAGRMKNIRSFGAMRDARNIAPKLPNAGWHYSWVGGTDYALHKLGAFCHPEIADRTLDGLKGDVFNTRGFHVDGQKLAPYTGTSFPRWVRDGSCPQNWWRHKAAV